MTSCSLNLFDHPNCNDEQTTWIHNVANHPWCQNALAILPGLYYLFQNKENNKIEINVQGLNYMANAGKIYSAQNNYTRFEI